MWIAVRETEKQKHGWKIKGLNQKGYGRNDVQMKKESTGFVNTGCDRNPCYIKCRGWASSMGICWKLLRNVGPQAPLETKWIKIHIWTRSPGYLYVYSSFRSTGQRGGESKRWQTSIFCFLVKGFFNILFFYRFLYRFLGSDSRPGTDKTLIISKNHGNNWKKKSFLV